MSWWDYRKAQRGEIRCEQCRYGNNTERWWSGRWSCTLHGMTAVGAKMTCQYAAQQEGNDVFTMKICKYCASPEGKGHDDDCPQPVHDRLNEVVAMLRRLVNGAGGMWGTDENFYAEIDPDLMDDAAALLAKIDKEG